ncbi:MAG: hypothetical protein IJW58_03755, partial [Clostridia bacterium]|nr:hypothetical protein [Clostridia bacterium]
MNRFTSLWISWSVSQLLSLRAVRRGNLKKRATAKLLNMDTMVERNEEKELKIEREMKELFAP